MTPNAYKNIFIIFGIGRALMKTYFLIFSVFLIYSLNTPAWAIDVIYQRAIKSGNTFSEKNKRKFTENENRNTDPTKLELKRIIDNILTLEPHEELGWTDPSGGCRPLSQQLYDFLIMQTKNQFKLKRIYFSGLVNIYKSSTKSVALHAYLLEESSGKPIIIDPTWKQFLREPQNLTHLDDVFIGTHEDLIHLFQSHLRQVKPQIEKSNKILDIRRLVYNTWPAEDNDYTFFELQQNF